jgi:hypothetical protein
MAAMRRIADVAGTKIVFLNVVPNRFRKCESHAIVDQAIYAIPGMGLVFDREAAKLTRKVPFSMFARSRTLQVGFTGSCGRVVASFDVASRSQPIPNADLIAAGVEFR